MLAEWVVPVKWGTTVALGDARRLQGMFANQHVVCKLRHPETLRFLEKAFGAGEQGTPA